ncbi:hypothetical protein P5618_029450 (plasmid) [Priestia megaterium]|uniref:hypothetical protein n=1 Tax=Priestia megaterium TaxID=1404 RepID=UPI002452F5BF|nr:hypothetical protein [Priestia megaterium]MDH3177884.1 hypothetical protein [Priestia megaterium]
MINLILAQAQSDQSLEEATKQTKELEKQISNLQDTLISTQNDKISSLLGDIGVIVGVFGLAFAIIFGLSTFAIIYIQRANKKAQIDMATAKELMEEARQLNEIGNSINKDAANELKEVQKKIQEVDYLLKFSQKQNLAYAKIRECYEPVESVKVFSSKDTYMVLLPIMLTEEILIKLDKYKTQREKLYEAVHNIETKINGLIDVFYSYVDKVENVKDMQGIIHRIDTELEKLESLKKEADLLLDQAHSFYISQEKRSQQNAKPKNEE